MTVLDNLFPCLTLLIIHNWKAFPYTSPELSSCIFSSPIHYKYISNEPSSFPVSLAQ